MKTRICVPVTADTVDQAIVDLKQAEKFTDLVELRIDFIKNIDIGKLEILLKNKTKEVIVTCRPKSLNGNFIGNEKERINLLKKSIELNAEFVDIESDSDNGLIGDIIQNKKNTKIIVSYHNFKETPKLEQLANIYNDIKKLNPDLIKIVTFAGSINDNFEIFKLLKDKNDLISFCMGLRGEISRILAPKYGSCITFASLNEEKVSAPGQIDINEMDNVYNFSLINEETMVIGLIGEHAEHSKSKSIMNPSFKDLKLNFVYLTFKLTTDELPAFMKNFRQFEFAGASVTIPHKLKIIKMIDEIDETAQKIGATNTIVNKNDKLMGYNTDYYGAIEALKEKTPLNNKKALVLGAGGAARAVIYGLKKEGAGITIVNRTKEKAEKLASDFDVKFSEINNMKKLVIDNDIIVNTTSVGMVPNINESIIKEDEFVSGKIVMDIVPIPPNTKLLKIAKSAGCQVISGNRMLLHQAIKQFRLWTGQDPKFKLMESKLKLTL